MPAGITHILLVKELQNRLTDSSEEELKDFLATALDFLVVGAVAPDLPYVSRFHNPFDGQNALADKLHYLKTNQVPLLAFSLIAKRYADGLDRRVADALLGFFVGYASHVIADGIVHPFVRDKVGDYRGHETVHRALEMVIDVLFYSHISRHSFELNKAEVFSCLENEKESDTCTLVFRTFCDLLKQEYGDEYQADDISDWVAGMARAFKASQEWFPVFVRGSIEGMIYPHSSECYARAAYYLTLSRPVDREENFLRVPTICFAECVDRFYAIFVPIVKKAYAQVYSGGSPLTEEELPAINLDTGRLLSADCGNDLSCIPSFWS